MRKRLFLTGLLITLTVSLFAQKEDPKEEKNKPLFGFKLTGLIKTDFIYDTRQTLNLREGSLVFYPEPELLDAEGNDINAKPAISFLSLQTKLTLAITGPDALGAKTSGLIEGEFFGNLNTSLNVFRLRHAFVRLNWKSTEVLAGQFWHPMYEVNCTPDVISADAGLPFKVYARNPQLRLTQQAGPFRFIATAMTQIDFVSPGPDGPIPRYIRNAAIPELDLQIQFLRKNDKNGNELQAGAGIDYLWLQPRLSTEFTVAAAYDTVINGLVVHHDAVKKTYKTDTRIGALSANAFFKIKVKPLTAKLGAVYSEDGYALSLIGGYAVKSVTDTSRNFVDYANIRTLAFFGDIATNGTKWQAALFGGFSRNLGAGEPVTGPYYGRGSNIDYLYRISPRAYLNIQKLRLAGEVEYTVAAYGKTTGQGYVTDSKEVANLRLLLAVYYFF